MSLFREGVGDNAELLWVESVTTAQVVAALIAEGGEKQWECEDWDHNPHHLCDHGPPCGMTLVFPLPVESAEAKETP